MKKDDTLWKGILEDVFDDFLRFFYSNAEEIFDLDRGFEFLDKELAEITQELESENLRYVDKLVKVWLKNGEEKWILVHVEVQGQSQKEVPERVFIYFYRIRDKFQQIVTTWVIYSDRTKSFHPKQYRYNELGTQFNFRFNTYKILDQDEETLKNDPNPFAIVVWTVLVALKKKKVKPDELVDLKMQIVRNLFERNISKKKIASLMNFLKYYMRFDKKHTALFEQKLDKYKGKTYPMGIRALLLDQAEKKGEIRGEIRGEKKGEIKGEIRGEARGISKKTFLFTKNLIEDGSFEDERIAKLADTTIEYVQQVRAQLASPSESEQAS